MKEEQPKTRAMEKAYHLLFNQIANHCMNTGIDMQTVNEHIQSYRVDVDAAFVKSTWRALLKAKTGKTSTTEMTKEDVQSVQQEFHRLWSEITGINFEFPSADNQNFNEWYNSQ